MLCSDTQTIIAQCTPKGSGALALLRLCGNDVFAVVDQFAQLASGKKIVDVASHTIHYGTIKDKAGQTIDHIMFLVMHGPRTFTGQDTVELTVHNNPFIIQNILECALEAGARLAHNGEFSRRAVLNNKIDLVQAEAINEVIHANTQMALKNSLGQLEGSLSSWSTNIERDLIKALAFCQASFEFIDEEDLTFATHIKTIITTVLGHIEHIKKTFDAQQQIRQGIRIALIGSVNAGKSSIFNALLNQERAIVTNIAGTTRDAIEAGVYRDNNYWTLIDTAGLRETNDVVEKKGIGRSFDEAHKADIILLIFDGSRKLTAQEKKIYTKLKEQYPNKVITIASKADLTQRETIFFDETVRVSTKKGYSLMYIEQKIQEKIKKLFSSIESPFLLNERQFNLLLNLESQLQAIVPMLEYEVEYELVSYHLNDAIAHLAEFTGKSISQAGMDKVFLEFCVGK